MNRGNKENGVLTGESEHFYNMLWFYGIRNLYELVQSLRFNCMA